MAGIGVHDSGTGVHDQRNTHDTHRVSYARARVQLHIRMDGSLAVYSGKRCLKIHDGPRSRASAPSQRLTNPSSETVRHASKGQN